MSNSAEKIRLGHLFCCRNSGCPKPGGLTTERELHIHYGKSLHCGAHVAACQAYNRRNNIVRSHPSPTQPWDIANNDDTTSVACVANYSAPTSNNTLIKPIPLKKQTNLELISTQQNNLPRLNS
jgi:hypothetical protein